MQMKNKVKSEKGIMTMYVTVAVVTFTIILVALFSLAVATRKNQIKTLIKIKEVYEQDNNKKEQIYLVKKQEIKCLNCGLCSYICPSNINFKNITKKSDIYE